LSGDPRRGPPGIAGSATVLVTGNDDRCVWELGPERFADRAQVASIECACNGMPGCLVKHRRRRVPLGDNEQAAVSTQRAAVAALLRSREETLITVCVDELNSAE
jgi:hypothetical protein